MDTRKRDTFTKKGCVFRQRKWSGGDPAKQPSDGTEEERAAPLRTHSNAERVVWKQRKEISEKREQMFDKRERLFYTGGGRPTRKEDGSFLE